MNLHDSIRGPFRPSKSLLGTPASASLVSLHITHSVEELDPLSRDMIERVRQRLDLPVEEMRFLVGFSYIAFSMLHAFSRLIDGEIGDQSDFIVRQARTLRLLTESAPRVVKVVNALPGMDGGKASRAIHENLPDRADTAREPRAMAEHPLRFLAVLTHPECPAVRSADHLLVLPRLLMNLSSAALSQESSEIQQLIRTVFISIMTDRPDNVEPPENEPPETDPLPGALMQVMATHSPPTLSHLVHLLSVIRDIQDRGVVVSVNKVLSGIEPSGKARALESILIARTELENAKIPARVINDLFRRVPSDSLIPFLAQAQQTPDIVRLYMRLEGWGNATGLSNFAPMMLSLPKPAETVATLMDLTKKVGLREQVARLVVCHQDVQAAGRLEESLNLLSKNPPPKVFETYLGGIVAGKVALVDAIASTVISNTPPKALVDTLDEEGKVEFEEVFPQNINKKSKLTVPQAVSGVQAARKTSWAERLHELLPGQPALITLGLELLDDGSPQLQRALRELIRERPACLLPFLDLAHQLPTVEQLGRALQNKSVLPHIIEILEERKTRKIEQLKSIFGYSSQLSDSELSSAILKIT